MADPHAGDKIEKLGGYYAQNVYEGLDQISRFSREFSGVRELLVRYAWTKT
jgi:hypothetical protein